MAVTEGTSVVTASGIVTEALETSDVATQETTWEPIDLAPVLNGNYQRLQPTLGCRADGVALLYPARIHSLAGESEAGKSWIALLWVTEVMLTGGDVIYVDFEDEQSTIVGRLLELGADPNLILQHFRYVRPQQARLEAATLLLPDEGTCALVVIDGVTELMAMYGRRTTDDVDVADTYLLPRALASKGPAVLLLDHVVKDRQSRGRWATGSQHKLSGINGAAYLLEAKEPFAEGKSGSSDLFIAKDRPGAIRGRATKVKAEKYAIAQLVVTGGEGPSTFSLVPYAAPSKTVFLPTAKMEHVCQVLAEAAPTELSYNQIRFLVGGKSEYARRAVDALNEGGYVAVNKGAGNRTLHSLTRAYTAPPQ